MAFEVTKVYMEHFPALRFIGKRYTNDDRDEKAGFGTKWEEWGNSDRFDVLKKAVHVAPFDATPIGLMTDASQFTYWIGLFFPAGTAVPDGYDYLDLPESDIGTGWVCGKDSEIYGAPPMKAVCMALWDAGYGKHRYDILGPGSNTICFFERYVSGRFDVADENGNVTLDYGNYF